jgi:hypothetical protein
MFLVHRPFAAEVKKPHDLSVVARPVSLLLSLSRRPDVRAPAACEERADHRIV